MCTHSAYDARFSMRGFFDTNPTLLATTRRGVAARMGALRADLRRAQTGLARTMRASSGQAARIRRKASRLDSEDLMLRRVALASCLFGGLACATPSVAPLGAGPITPGPGQRVAVTHNYLIVDSSESVRHVFPTE